MEKIIDSLSDDEKVGVTNLCGKFGLYDFAALLQRMDVMISNDTGPMHLAAAMGTKTIGLFGPNLPSRF